MPSPRLRRRRKLLLASAPAALAGCAGRQAAEPAHLRRPGTAAYAAGQGDGTVSAGQAMGVLNWWNAGRPTLPWATAMCCAANSPGARRHFRERWTSCRPDESCKVRVNLVLSLEKLGEAKKKPGTRRRPLASLREGEATSLPRPRATALTPKAVEQPRWRGQALKDAKKRLDAETGGRQGRCRQEPADGGSSSPGRRAAAGEQTRSASKERPAGPEGTQQE